MSYNKNVPKVPEINCKGSIKKIQSKICELSEDNKESITDILMFHSCEPSAAAERISELLDVDYSAIYDLL